MSYELSHFENAMNGFACESGQFWWPSYPNWQHTVKSRISNTYRDLLGRYAEPGHLENWFNMFVSQYPDIASDPWSYPTPTHLNNAIIAGAQISGEWGYFHNWLGRGSCPPPPVYGCTNPTAGNYNPSADTDNGSCWWYNASVSILANPTSIIVGQSTTISWSSSNAQSVVVSGGTLNSTSLNGSKILSPYSTTTYSIIGSAYESGAPGSDSVIVNVYVPPDVILSTNTINDTIILGQSFTLTWNTTGDADTANLSPILGNVPVNSNQPNVSPTSTTTYTISVSGPGGNDSDDLTITVLQPPIVSIDSDSSVKYGEDVTITYSGVNCNESLSIVPVYTYLDNTTTTGATIQLTHGDNVSGTHIDSPPYNIIGPKCVLYTLTGNGNTLSDTDPSTTDFEIDQQPAFSVPESRDKLKDEDPVITPDSTVTTDTIEIDDIDIPVEIKSDHPIQVEVDDDNNWRKLREI